MTHIWTEDETYEQAEIDYERDEELRRLQLRVTELEDVIDTLLKGVRARLLRTIGRVHGRKNA